MKHPSVIRMIRKIIPVLMVIQSLILVAGTPFSEHFTIHRLSDGVYGLIHKMGGMAVGNSGLVDLGDKTLVFDTFLSPRAAREIPEIAQKLGLSPIIIVVNSHYHNDHIRGNQVFSDRAQIISTRKTAQLIRQNEPKEIEAEKKYAPREQARFESLLKRHLDDKAGREYQNLLMWHGYFKALATSHDILHTRVPDRLMGREEIITGSRRTARLMCLGGGHSESDLVLYLPEDQILFTGDLVFIGMHPYLADGSIRRLKTYLTALQNLGIRKLVPGHGPVGDAGALQVMKDYLRMIEKQVMEIIKAGSSMKGAETAEVPAPFRTWWFENFYHSSLRFVLKNSVDDAAGSDSHPRQ